jgi:hypothetical protein
MVADQMLSWRRDLGEDACHVLHSVDALGRCRTRVVATALGEVQHLVGARQPLQARQAHRWPHHIADQGLDTSPIAWRDMNGVVKPKRENQAFFVGNWLCSATHQV